MKRLSEAQFREKSLSANPYLLIIQIGIPLAVFALFASLFSLLDTVMASHLGTIEVSTVAYMNQLRMILNSIGTGLGTGSMILINRAYGAGDMKRTNELTNTLIRLLLILSAAFLIMMIYIHLSGKGSLAPISTIDQVGNVVLGAIIGGTSMSGGSGTIAGTILGVFIMSILQTGLPKVGLQANYQQIIIGVVLLVAVYIDVLKNKKLS